MQYFMLLGGFAGFTLTFFAGLLAGNDAVAVVVNAGIGCLVGATLLRGFRHVYTGCIRAVVVERAQPSPADPAPNS